MLKPIIEPYNKSNLSWPDLPILTIFRFTSGTMPDNPTIGLRVNNGWIKLNGGSEGILSDSGSLCTIEILGTLSLVSE